MKRLSGALVFWSIVALLLVRAILYAESLAEPVILKARIVQLEEQLRISQRNVTICSAQLLIANQPQQDEESRNKLNGMAKEMGCTNGANWSVNPPACN